MLVLECRLIAATERGRTLLKQEGIVVPFDRNGLEAALGMEDTRDLVIWLVPDEPAYSAIRRMIAVRGRFDYRLPESVAPLFRMATMTRSNERVELVGVPDGDYDIFVRSSVSTPEGGRLEVFKHAPATVGSGGFLLTGPYEATPKAKLGRELYGGHPVI